jgi:hypothetical protein
MRTLLVAANEDRYRGVFDCLRRSLEVEMLVTVPPGASKRKAGIIARQIACELSAFPRILRAVLGEPHEVGLICSTSHYGALMALHVASLFGRRTRVYLFNYYLHGLGRRRLVRLLLKLALTRSVGICVQSPNEVDYFQSLNPGTRVDYYPYSGQAIDGVGADEVRFGDYVFAGGYTNRDYETVVKAARRVPHLGFLIVCSAANRLPPDLPRNVRVIRDVERHVFYSLLAASRCVIVPLKHDVGSSGQMVALGAMQFGKLTLYADFATVSQYFTNGVTGVAYRPGDADDLCRKLIDLLGDSLAPARIGEAAQEDYRRRFAREDVYNAAIAAHALRFLTA